MAEHYQLKCRECWQVLGQSGALVLRRMSLAARSGLRLGRHSPHLHPQKHRGRPHEPLALQRPASPSPKIM